MTMRASAGDDPDRPRDGDASLVDVGLRSLRWLMSMQTTSSGHFRPVGTKSFGKFRRKPQAFDQQPVEAAAAISACLAALQADGRSRNGR